jgi:hypothetical protein
MGTVERVPVTDVRAGDWIVTDDRDPGDPVQLFWRTGLRTPDGAFRWSFKTSAGFRHFDQDAWVAQVLHAEPPASVDTESAGAEISHDVVSTHAIPEAGAAAELMAERTMLHAIIRDSIVALPFTIAVLVGMMALALSDKQPWYAWVGLGAAMGVYAAGFFGTIAGVMLSAHVLDDVDEAVMREPAVAARTYPD